MVMHAGGTEAISNMPAMLVPVAIGMFDIDMVMDWAVVAPMAARKVSAVYIMQANTIGDRKWTSREAKDCTESKSS